MNVPHRREPGAIEGPILVSIQQQRLRFEYQRW